MAAMMQTRDGRRNAQRAPGPVGDAARARDQSTPPSPPGLTRRAPGAVAALTNTYPS